MLLDECATPACAWRPRAASNACATATATSVPPAHHARRFLGAARSWSPAAGCRFRSMGASGLRLSNSRASSATTCCRRAAGLVPLTLSGKHQERLGGSQRRRVAGAKRSATAQRFDERLLVTHRGVSGPAILQISSFWQPGDDLRLDLLPGRTRWNALQRHAANVRPPNSRPCSATCCPSASPSACANTGCPTGR